MIDSSHDGLGMGSPVGSDGVATLPNEAPDPREKTILVAGATGRVGGAVVRHFLKAGLYPRALTRNPTGDAALELLASGVEVVQGDMNDISTLRTAVEGAYGVFNLQDSRKVGFGEEVRQGQNMADAARGAGVAHFVSLSAASAERWPGIQHLEAKYAVERHLRWIGLKRTILRPVLLMEDHIGQDPGRWVRHGHFGNPLPSDRRVQLISLDDLGAVTAAVFQNPDRYLGGVIPMAGDELTNQEIAEVMSRVSGKKVRFRRSLRALGRLRMGQVMSGTYRKLRASVYGLDVEEIRHRHAGIGLRTVEEWLRERLGTRNRDPSGSRYGKPTLPSGDRAIPYRSTTC